MLSPELKNKQPLLDYNQIKTQVKVQKLPRIIDAQPHPKKEPLPPYDFRLPKQFKFTNNPDLVNVETLRKKIRINRFKHMEYDQS